MNKPKKKVMVAGTFDLFHKGHEFFLSEAKKHGDLLFVIIARDSNVEKIKHKTTEDTEGIRLQNIVNYHAVTEAFLGDEHNFFRIPKQINPDVICLGYDQKPPKGFAEHFPNTEIIRLDSFYPEQYKSSLMKKRDIPTT